MPLITFTGSQDFRELLNEKPDLAQNVDYVPGYCADEQTTPYESALRLTQDSQVNMQTKVAFPGEKYLPHWLSSYYTYLMGIPCSAEWLIIQSYRWTIEGFLYPRHVQGFRHARGANIQHC